jgi:hypothetical protein
MKTHPNSIRSHKRKPRPHHHSYRNATSGSTCEARRAGIQQAIKPVSNNKIVTLAKVIGS